MTDSLPKDVAFVNPRAEHDFKGRTCSIVGVGSYVPERRLTNADLEEMVETSDEWITTRTGIKERRIASDDQFTSDLATEAARKAMSKAGVTGGDIDLVIVATITPDMPFPSTACLVQHNIGAVNAAAFDLEAACSGFIYALEIAQQFIMSRTYDTVLVIGAEKLSSIIDWKDRNTCVLFGDGAGAAVLQNREQSHGLLTACMGADGGKAGLLSMPGGGSRCPATSDSLDNRLHYLRMDGKETYKSAVTAMHRAALKALERCQLDITQIKCIIPHQANLRIISAVAARLNYPMEKVFMNIHKYGNTSGASIPIGLNEAKRSGRIQPGETSVLGVVGAGLTWGSAVIKW